MAKIEKEVYPERLSRGDVEHVARLARVEITEEEKEQFTSELTSILDYVAKLNSADTENTEPISQISGLENVTREDKISESLGQEKVLLNAPDNKDGFIKVKQVFEP